MRVAWCAVWAAVWIAGACRPSSSDVTWSSDVGPPTSQQAIWVDFADGSRLGGASVERTGPASARARFHWAPSKSLDGAQIELRLFPSNGGASIPVNAVRLRGRGEEAAIVQVAFDDEALRRAHPHWLMAQLQRPDGEAVAAAAFPGDWVSLGAVRPAGAGPLTEHPLRAAALRLAAGGDANLGRRQNGLSGMRGPADALSRLPMFSDADIGFLNLESVLADSGALRVEKGEPVPFYFRGRPEQAQVLTTAGIDVVGTANNHSGDYGPDALLQQKRILSQAGVLAPGSGPSQQDACAPVFLERGGVTVGIISVDATLSLFAATDSSAGTCHASASDTGEAMATIGPAIADARRRADVVFVAIHWGKNLKSRPSSANRRLGAAMVEAGADAILGSSAHKLHGIEIVNGRPVIYDAGNLLFDSHSKGELARSGVFVLHFDRDGVHRVDVHPIDVDYGYSRPASGNSAARTLTRFRDLSAELGTRVVVDDGIAVVPLPSPPSRPPAAARTPPRTSHARPVMANTVPPAACLADAVPADAVIEPRSWGSVHLVGARMMPARPTERRTVWVETWWKIDAPVSDDLWMRQRIKSIPHRPVQMWWADHEHCDWMWPTSRWVPGQLYRDVYGVRPPKRAEPGDYELVIGLIRDESPVGENRRILSFEYR